MKTTTTYLGQQIKKNRIHVLIFVPNPESEELKKQLDALQLAERSIDKETFDVNIVCNNRQSKYLYQMYNVPFNRFTVMVVNKDKEINYRRHKTISPSELYNLLH